MGSPGVRVALDSAREAGRYDIYGGRRIGKTSLGLETGSWLVANGLLHGQPARRDGIDDVDPSHSAEAPVAGESGQPLVEWSRCASHFGQIQRQVAWRLR